MAALDWIFVALLLASMLIGAWRGLVYEVLSLAGWVVIVTRNPAVGGAKANRVRVMAASYPDLAPD